MRENVYVYVCVYVCVCVPVRERKRESDAAYECQRCHEMTFTLSDSDTVRIE